MHGTAYDDDDVYVMVNASPAALAFGIHEGLVGSWRRVIDTAEPSPRDILEPGQEVVVPSPHYQVQGRSVVVLLRKRGTPPRSLLLLGGEGYAGRPVA